MIHASRKDNKESFDNLLRRFNRKVQQSGNLAVVRQKQFHQKPLSKTERRKLSVITERRRAAKLDRMRTGGRLRGF